MALTTEDDQITTIGAAWPMLNYGFDDMLPKTFTPGLEYTLKDSRLHYTLPDEDQ